MPEAPEQVSHVRTTLRRLEHWTQTSALRLLGLRPEDRERVVEIMLERRRDNVGYWLLLMISTGIATLGLALGSTAVVIGAMLIAPLMGPIVELGMALVIGSPALTLRALIRTVGSVLAVVSGAAGLTLLLPFQEITSEISARTFPTALDLLIAVFVAFIAVLTTVRASSETTSAAAGTAIGIALVPPVCVIGYGVGIADWSVAGGAALLFITNLAAILFISVVAFFLLGFEHVDAGEWERAAIRESRPGGLTLGGLAAIERVFGSRYGRVVRVGTPALLIAVTYMPLSAALDQVAWEVRARAAVSRVLAAAVADHRTVHSSTTVARRSIHMRMYVVGAPEDANELREQLRSRVAAETGVVPSLDVASVPDLDAVRRAAPAPAPSPGVELPPATRLPAIQAELQDALRSTWPSELGTLLSWRLVLRDTLETPTVEVTYLGAEAGPATEALIARVLAERMGVAVAVRSTAVSTAQLTEGRARGVEWLAAFYGAARQAEPVPGLHLCVETPRGRTAAERELIGRVDEAVRAEAARNPRVALAEGDSLWSLELRAGGCAAPPTEAGTGAEPREADAQGPAVPP